MAEDVTRLNYELLKQVSIRLERVEADIGEIKVRLTAFETTQGLMRQEMAQRSIHIATPNSRIERMDERLDRMDKRLDRSDGRLARIERRLDLTDA